MIAPRLLAKQTVTKQLRDLGCERLAIPIEEHSVWRAPNGFVFIVPECGPDKRCPEAAMGRILTELVSHGGVAPGDIE